MPLSKEELEQAKAAWEKVRKQARIDIDQADMYLETIDKKLKEMIPNGK